MPVCTLRLLSLTTSLQQFCSLLSQDTTFCTSLLVKAKVVRWIIKPTTISVSPLLTQSPTWDLLLIHTGASELPSNLKSLVNAQWTITSGIPSRLVTSFAETNDRLLHPEQGSVPPRTHAAEQSARTSSAQSLELSGELWSWIQSPAGQQVHGAVSMLNLLAFKQGKKAEYLKYGQAFAQSVGARHGGMAKLVGNALACSSSPDGSREWDETALAHYPSLHHFADMLASEDYQEANQKWRVGSLEDTCILCTSELLLPVVEGSKPRL
ncbi:hypothetical protein MMC13_004825 [Lambiella insularis]|nr:hypothetical protein [Lambiella insularis]